MRFVSERRPGEVRIPNYVYDIWMPLLGLDAIGVYSVYCRLEREGTVKAMSQQRLAQEMRIGIGKLRKINDLLQRYGFISIRAPENNQERLMHYTIELTIHDPPRSIPAETIAELKHPQGYETLCPWLTDDEPSLLPNGNAGNTKQECPTNPNGNANVAPLVFAPSVVEEEPPSADPLDDSEIDEIAATFKTPPPRERRTAEQVKAGIGKALETFAKNGDGRAGVADPTKAIDAWMDRPVKAWCAFIRLPYDEQSAGRKALLASDLRTIATTGGLDKTPADVVKALRVMAESASCQWLRTAGRPTHKEFTNVLTNVLCGQVLPEGGNGNGGASTPREQPTEVVFATPDFLGVSP